MAMATLTQSSAKTREWLSELRDRLPELGYKESRFWATFRSSAARGVVAYLNPSQKTVRLFLMLAPGYSRDLEATPSSSDWAKRCPSVFQIGAESDLPRAAQLIGESEASAVGQFVRATGLASKRPQYIAPDELTPGIEYTEGAGRSVTVNAFERNRRAREKCLEHFGRNCAVCGFSFESRYGDAAAGYVQVHHVVPLATVRKSYRLDPIRDLRPVCPNCHAVIHRREPAFTIAEVKAMLKSS